MTGRIPLAIAAVAAALACTGTSRAADSERVYELRTYTTHAGKLANLHARFADHTMELFEKHGISNIAYCTPTDPARRDNTLVYVISHKSRDAAKRSWRAFGSDPAWQKVARESQIDGPILAKAPESVYLKTTDFSPNNTKKSDQSRLFELRKYTTAEGRLGALLRRFRDGELKLFEDHGMTNIVYWTPTDQKNTLIYVVAHKDRSAARRSWQGFSSDPAWKKLHKASLEAGKIVIKVENQFLTPTDFSPLK